jgi:RNA polymerase sigma-70 factor (ECF subfamily)
VVVTGEANVESSFQAESIWLDDVLVAQRPRIVRFCARWTGDSHAAEDLAQETLVEAWRHAHALRNPEAHMAWLMGIARNVCLRWQRRERGSDTYLDAATGAGATGDAGPRNEPAADYDLELELERDELAELLERALSLLPAYTRAALVEKYIMESPHAEIGARLGVSEGAVAMRLQRGKLALKRVLAGELRDEAAAYGLITETDGWDETRLWCPLCGQRRLRGRRSADYGLALECANCAGRPGGMMIDIGNLPDLAHIKGYRSVYARVCDWSNAYYRRAIAAGTAPCTKCGRPAALRRGVPPHAPPQHRDIHAVHLPCEACESASYSSLNGLTLHLPEVRRFWRAHPRMRMLSAQGIDFHGRAGLLIRCEALVGPAQLDVISAEDSYELLGVVETVT